MGDSSINNRFHNKNHLLPTSFIRQCKLFSEFVFLFRISERNNIAIRSKQLNDARKIEALCWFPSSKQLISRKPAASSGKHVTAAKLWKTCNLWQAGRKLCGSNNHWFSLILHQNLHDPLNPQPVFSLNAIQYRKPCESSSTDLQLLMKQDRWA